MLMLDTRTLLQELYELDPELKAHEPELLKLISELAARRPQAQLDASFQQRLRTQLMARARQLDVAPAKPSFSLIHFLTMPKFAYAIGGMAVIVVAVVAATSFLDLSPSLMRFGSERGGLAFTPTITKVESNAFGNLAQLSSAAPQGLGGDASALKAGAPQALVATQESVRVSQTSPNIAVSSPGFSGGGATGIAITRPYPYPEPAAYRFVYRGEPLGDLSSQVDVLKRMTGPEGAPSASDILSNLNFTGLDLGSFSNLDLAQITLNQDQEYGYSLYLDLVSGSVSVNQNWMRWPQPMQNCQDQACFDRFRLKESDMPDDATIIDLARGFLAEHGVDVSSLGEPYVMDDWRVMYQRMPATDRIAFYFPEQVNVLFPLKVQGREVFEGGQKSGLGVGVSLRDKRATGVWNLTTQNYQASAYAAETDGAKIITLAEQGGGSGWPWAVPMPYLMKTDLSFPSLEPAPGDEPKVPAGAQEVQLGTPLPAYLKTWSYQPQTYAAVGF